MAAQEPPEPELAKTLKPATDVVAHSASLGRFLNKLEYTDTKRSRSGIAARQCRHLRQPGQPLHSGCGAGVARLWMLALLSAIAFASP
ncbi:MAG: hypothetical protein P8Q92_12675 [Pseudoprimorskyibacter sp.]|nr:hypothetical protein [Pseudoprimorskyibacter sp.]